MKKKMNNDDKDNSRTWCCLHPQELVIGVCALCLNEKLLLLASKQRQQHVTNRTTAKIYGISSKRALPKISALTSLLNRLDTKQQKPEVVYDSSSTSQEDSFISIKFEGNGLASWDQFQYQSKASLPRNNHDEAENVKTVIEHTKPRPAMRWQKRIGRLFQLIKWKRSSKGNICHVGSKLHEGPKVKKYGWIKNMTENVNVKL